MDFFYDWCVLRRDAVIYTLSQTEEGIEYLNNAYLWAQTDADRSGLRRLQKEMAGG
jgi:hypothetical protein